MSSSTYIVLGIFIIIGALLILASRRRPQTGRAGLFPREEQEQAREQLDRLVADIQELSKEHIARLDTKIRMLQQLIADADARIRELRPLLPPTGAGAPPAAGARPPAPPPKFANPLHERVYALADAGKTVDEICAEVGLERGEVELILGLRKASSLGG